LKVFRLIPRGPESEAILIRRSAILEAAGMVLLTAALFTDAPLPLLVCVSLGTLMMLGGFLNCVLVMRAQ
jgi:hypothetical protein